MKGEQMHSPFPTCTLVHTRLVEAWEQVGVFQAYCSHSPQRPSLHLSLKHAHIRTTARGLAKMSSLERTVKDNAVTWKALGETYR